MASDGMFCSDFIVVRPPVNVDKLFSLILFFVEACTHESWLFLSALRIGEQDFGVLLSLGIIFPLDEEGFN